MGMMNYRPMQSAEEQPRSAAFLGCSDEQQESQTWDRKPKAPGLQREDFSLGEQNSDKKRSAQSTDYIWCPPPIPDPHTPYLGDLGVGAAAVTTAGVHPAALVGQAVLPQSAALLRHAPATFEAWVGLQAQPTALPQG